MRYLLTLNILLIVFNNGFPQDPKDFANGVFLKKLNSDTSYVRLKKEIVSGFSHIKPGKWGESVNGVMVEIKTRRKYVVLTFDACGGKNGNGYDKELIDFLHQQKVPATLFVSGKWIDANFGTFMKLSKDTLFEIENHGLNHKPCSIDGKIIYGIHGTSNIEEAFDEVEANALKIKALTHIYPKFYRSATAFMDEASASMVKELNITPVSFRILSGDAISSASDNVIEQNVLKKISPGAIVMMHFNHPERNTFEAMKKIIPELRKKGYGFVRLNNSEGFTSK
jgi:peptidoglycan/xylan/chitin deacetylase (PgdA/CDA1 family)